MRQLLAIKMELRKRMHDPIVKTGAWVEQMLRGHPLLPIASYFPAQN
jgi:hypothetical protein